MFLNKDVILKSIHNLSNVHPFHGITYLVCKKNLLPINKTIELALDSENKLFLEKNHKLDPSSDYFYQPFKSTNKWLRNDYASSGLQAINTQTFTLAFIHPKGSRTWGWNQDYLSILESKLIKKNKIPLFYLAVWIFKFDNFSNYATPEDILSKFIIEYDITDEELNCLFDNDIPREYSSGNLYQNGKVSWGDLKDYLSLPPDAKPEQGGTLSFLATKNIGPAKEFLIEPARRLNIITGDNGLGKSFILESAWWALTNTWTDKIAYPDPRRRGECVSLEFSIKGNSDITSKHSVAFDWSTFTWPSCTSRPTIPGLIVYGKVDGSFAVWDPARQFYSGQDKEKSIFSNSEVWNGQLGRIEGLIRDWVNWQNSSDRRRFIHLQRILEKLSPPDLGILRPGKSVRIPEDPREIPTLIHPYGEIPITNASAGVRRIVALSYLIVWAWNEHLVTSEQMNISPQKNMVVLIDELEAHLHPKWQRAFLPSLMDLGEILFPELKIQFIIATHSPLVMASSEEIFEEEMDSLFHLQLDDAGEINMGEIEFIKYGDISSWLMSPIFELKQARSIEGEMAIEDAKEIQQRPQISKDEVSAVSIRLKKFLSESDRFWPRWIAFAEKHGVDL